MTPAREILWTLDEAVQFIRDRHQAAFNLGYNLSLGGGVLMRGWSTNDLDIVCTIANGRGEFKDYARFVDWIQTQHDDPITVGWWNTVTNKIHAPDNRLGRKVDWFVGFVPGVQQTHA